MSGTVRVWAEELPNRKLEELVSEQPRHQPIFEPTA